MNRYLDVKIKPDAETPENWLLNKVYTKLHKAIFDISATDIGVSFPQVEIKLGDVIRIHSIQDGLNKLQKAL
jgi:CRISPR-associated endonuclease Csy4